MLRLVRQFRMSGTQLKIQDIGIQDACEFQPAPSRTVQGPIEYVTAHDPDSCWSSRAPFLSYQGKSK